MPATYLGPNQPPNSLLGRSHRLVPRALGAVRIVLGHGARGGDGVARDRDAGVRDVVLETGFVLLGFACVLLRWMC